MHFTFLFSPSEMSVLSFNQILTGVSSLSNRINLIRSSVLYFNLIGPDALSNNVDWLIIRPRKWWTGMDKGNLKTEFDLWNGDIRFVNSRKAFMAVIGEWR